MWFHPFFLVIRTPITDDGCRFNIIIIKLLTHPGCRKNNKGKDTWQTLYVGEVPLSRAPLEWGSKAPRSWGRSPGSPVGEELAWRTHCRHILCLLIKEGQFSHVAPQSVTWSWLLVPNCGAWLVTPESWCEIEKKNRSAKFHSYVLTFPRILPQNTYNSTIYLKTRPLNALNENAEVYTDVKLQDFTKVPWRKLNVQWRWSHFLALNARIV